MQGERRWGQHCKGWHTWFLQYLLGCSPSFPPITTLWFHGNGSPFNTQHQLHPELFCYASLKNSFFFSERVLNHLEPGFLLLATQCYLIKEVINLTCKPIFYTQMFHIGNIVGGSDRKESACKARDPGLISESGRHPGEGNGNPLQYSCLEIPRTDHGLQSQTRLTH